MNYPKPSPSEKEKVNSFVLSWFDRHGRSFAWRRTTDPYAVLIAEMMLQRTRAGQAEKVWNAFMERYPNLEAARTAPPEDLAELLRPLGLQWRIRNIIGAIRSLERLETPDDLQGVPGIGHYVESAVRCFAFGERVPVVDANVVRFYSLVFKFPVDDRTRRDPAFHAFAASLLPDVRCKEYNWGLIDLMANTKADVSSEIVSIVPRSKSQKHD
jgi:A/G-specific adenine glycosylase